MTVMTVKNEIFERVVNVWAGTEETLTQDAHNNLTSRLPGSESELILRKASFRGVPEGSTVAPALKKADEGVEEEEQEEAD